MASESESREGHTRPHELINSMNNGTASDGVLSPGEHGGESASHPDRRLIGRLDDPSISAMWPFNEMSWR